jgi:hypothetical protein
MPGAASGAISAMNDTFNKQKQNYLDVMDDCATRLWGSGPCDVTDQQLHQYGLANRTSPTIPTISERQFMAFACARVVHYAGSALSLRVIRAKSWSSTSICSTTGSTSTVPFA